MSNDGAAPTQPDTEWQLLAEYLAAREPHSAAISVESMVSVVRALKLPPAQLAQIRETVITCVNDAQKAAVQDRTGAHICFRVWIALPFSKKQAVISSDGHPDLEPGRNSWGFFLTTRRISISLSGEYDLIELFLYVEGANHDRPDS